MSSGRGVPDPVEINGGPDQTVRRRADLVGRGVYSVDLRTLPWPDPPRAALLIWGVKMVDDFYFTISINEILIGVLVLVGVVALGAWTLEKLVFAPHRKDRA